MSEIPTIRSGTRLSGLPAAEINAGVRAANQLARQPGQRIPPATLGGGGLPSIVHGVVKEGTAAKWDNNCNAIEPGTIKLWRWIAPPLFDVDTAYGTDEVVTHDGTNYCSQQAVAGDGSAFDSADWVATDASKIIDRSGSTTDLEHYLTITPTEGASASWLGESLVTLTCDAMTGWS